MAREGVKAIKKVLENSKRYLAVIMAASLAVLTGCGRQDEVVEKEDTISDKYTVETFSLEAGIRPPVLAGTKAYSVKESDGADYTLCCMDIDNGETINRTISMEGRSFNLVNFTADPKGNIYFALTIKPEGDSVSQWKKYIMKWNGEGEEEYIQKITEDIGPAFLQMQVDEQGRLSFRYDRVYQFDEDGQYLGEKEYVFDPAEADRLHQQALSLEKFGISSEEVRNVTFLEDGRIEALVQSSNTGGYELFVLTPSEVSVNANKTEIVLGVLQGNPLMRSLAADFNKSRQDVYVTIREYQLPDGSRTMEDAVSVLMGDLLSGNGPDLIALSPGGNHALLVEQGILEDLQPYVDQSGIIHQEDFLPNVWELGRQEDLLYALPLRFSLQTLTGKASILGEQDGWTTADVMTLAEKYPESLLVDPSSSSSVFSLCCTFQAEVFVDREAAECHFDSPRFYEILEFAGGFAPDTKPDSISDTWKYQEESVLLMEADLYDADSCLAVCQAFGTEDLNFIGYPTHSGSPGHMLLQCNDMYGISSRSDHKREAWEFVEYYVQWDAESTRSAGFPADSRQLERWFEEKIDNGKSDGLQTGDLEGWIIRAAEGAVTEIKWGRETEILLEEVSLYFSDQKSMDETIKAIQNRVNLYLKETQ